MKNGLFAFICFFLIGQAFALSSPISDPRLIGTWEGKRSTATGCYPLSWKVTRKSDGQFIIDFFTPDNRHLFTETGRWWVSGSSIFVQGAGAKEADEYRFTIHSSDAIEFAHVRASPESDCQNEPPFIDTRVNDAH